MILGRACIAYSMPFPRFIKPKVHSTFRFFKPSEGFTESLLTKDMSGQPCGIILIFLKGTPSCAKRPIAVLIMTTTASLLDRISFRTLCPFGSRLSCRVCRVVTTGFLRVSKKERM